MHVFFQLNINVFYICFKNVQLETRRMHLLAKGTSTQTTQNNIHDCFMFGT